MDSRQYKCGGVVSGLIVSSFDFDAAESKIDGHRACQSNRIESNRVIGDLAMGALNRI